MSALQRRQRLLVCTNPVGSSLSGDFEVSVNAATVKVTERICFSVPWQVAAARFVNRKSKIGVSFCQDPLMVTRKTFTRNSDAALKEGDLQTLYCL